MLSTYVEQSHLDMGTSFIHLIANWFLSLFALSRGGIYPYSSLYMKELSQKTTLDESVIIVWAISFRGTTLEQ